MHGMVCDAILAGSGWLELRQASGGSPMTAADARPLGEPGSLRRCSSALSAQFCIEAFVTSQGMEDSEGRGRSMHQEVRHHLGGK